MLLNSQMKRILLVGIPTLAVLLYYLQSYLEDVKPFKPTQNSQQATVLQVSGTTSSFTSISQTITATAILSSIQKGKISSELSSKIEFLYVTEGQLIKKGDTLAVLEKNIYLIELEKIRGDFFKALTEFISELKLTNSQKVGQWEAYLNEVIKKSLLPPLPNSLSQNKLMSIVRYNLHNHYAQVKQSEQKLKQCFITAPFMGIISDIKVFPGATVTLGTVLLTLTDLSRMRVEIAVLEADLSFIKIGTSFEFLESPTNSYPVSAIHPQIDPDSRSGRVLAVIANDQKKYRDGQRVMVKLVRKVFTNRLVVPHSAILTRNDRELVFVVKNGISKWQYVKMGVSNRELVEIIEGVAPGDTVVTGGHYSLAHDVPVKVILTED